MTDLAQGRPVHPVVSVGMSIHPLQCTSESMDSGHAAEIVQCKEAQRGACLLLTHLPQTHLLSLPVVKSKWSLLGDDAGVETSRRVKGTRRKLGAPSIRLSMNVRSATRRQGT